ncbi:ATP-dependent Clp protease ATP-binding subunit ClpA [Rickettsiales endosymbiont of Paramecium tredecaurelia]|uniref:AAA family ATPase n=1 Tax=Candidatus Sarmatiella mevalonica TaxID=2770581 RepID=UPI0019217FBE|nr:AAA family ATPase [Candidatus Sarmatiella mevalonica]MBL3284939.1 ATP-dependent Clp protease ATP-binding subunit ClpA [Candidatus Sarmatiella mevalonica]
MINRNTESVLHDTFAIAANYGHEYIKCEHLLLALCCNTEAISILTAVKVDLEKMVERLHEHMNHSNTFSVSVNTHPKTSAEFQSIMHKVIMRGKDDAYQNYSTIGAMLLELLEDTDSYCSKILREFGVTRASLIRNIQYSKNTSKQISMKTERDAKCDSNTHHAVLEQFCNNLNNHVKDGQVDLLIGRESEVNRMIEILCRRRKNNVILVGDPGVGKTAIAEGLAYMIVNNNIPESLKGYVIYSLDIGRLVAGAKYRGDFEERINKLITATKNLPKIILFIDEIHMLIGAGSTMSGGLDASNLLKPALARGEIRCIGSTTFKEYHRYFEKDMALTRRFQKLLVSEPDVKSTVHILNGLKSYYEQYHGVVYTKEAIEAAVLLSERYIHDRHLPDKAIDLMDESGARKRIAAHNDNKISKQDIEQTVSAHLNIPGISLDKNDIEHLASLEEKLKQNIFGQGEAIKELCNSIKLSWTGLKRNAKPTGTYLFAGPNGVGKRELGRILADTMHMHLLHIDMAEYSEKHTISKLLGSPPGYTGFEQGGYLTEAIDKNPYSIILFDDVSKASPEILNILVQILDEGKLTDNTGKVINFRHTIIILTVNTDTDCKGTLGFNKKRESDTKLYTQDFIKNIISSDMRNKLDGVIFFGALDGESLHKIVQKKIERLSDQLKEKNIHLTCNKSIAEFLTNYCNESVDGLRALDRIINSKLKQKIVDEMLFGKLKKGGGVSIHCDQKQKILFTFKSSNARAKTALYKEAL